ncbi:hypothetical protein [Paraflavitalea sp. CAU 1676]|uniref:tetratricopeptide repeat protein n=1 Tax=Paraflavitalea sp. CAU 1676 TaxID=3032598 RepID=UPI0023DA41A4|nr:hypothetical protein [Paraflavitalea sp. CAU 1676]MDF2191901.1 hypothetical protein [Paraflavitalea sp. CAU 1676]
MSDLIMSKINRCRNKLSQLKAAYDSSGKKNRYSRVIDSDGLKVSVPYHPYELNPCMTEEEINSFEQNCGILLPSEFRLSLLHLGNGGGLFWDELVPGDFYKDEFDETDFLLLDTEWPYDTVLKISGEYANQVYSVYTQGNEEDILLANSFLKWLEGELDEQLGNPTTFFDDEKESGEDGDLDVNQPQRIGVNAAQNEDPAIEKLVGEFASIYLYDKKKKAIIISQVKELVIHRLITEQRYMSLMDGAFTNHLHEMQAFIGERALELHQDEKIKLSPHQLVQLMELTGLGYMNLGDHRAIELFEKSIGLSGNTFHFANIANTLLKLARFDEARLYIDKAPPTFYTLHIKGSLFTATGDDDAAIRCFEAGIASYDAYAPNYEGLGDIYAAKKQYEKAIGHYRNAINKCHNTSDSTFLKLAKIYALIQDTDGCLKVLGKLLKMEAIDNLPPIEADPAFEMIVQSDEYKKLASKKQRAR